MDSLKEQRCKNLLFIKEIDENNCYMFALNSLDFNNSGQYQVLIQTMFELLFKNPFLPRDYKIYIRSQDIYGDPSFRQLMTYNEDEIKDVRESILGLTREDCDFLVSDISSRNIQSHKRYLESDESVKIEYTKILFKALKNAYEYKTSKTLDIDFDSFLSSLKISIGDIRVSEENDTLRLENESLKKKLELKVPEKTVEKIVEKIVHIESPTKEPKPIEEIVYKNVVKNDKYIIPEELGREIKYESSPHIDIAFDFLSRGWFEEAQSEASKANNPLSAYASFLAVKRYKNIEDLILSNSYRDDIDSIFNMLRNMPSEATTIVLKNIIDVFYNTTLDFDRKTCLFKKMAAIKLSSVQQKKIRDKYFDYLSNSKEDFEFLKRGYECFYCSINTKNYEKTIIESLSLLHSKSKYSLVLKIKDAIFENIDTPQLSELILLCQTNSYSFDELLKRINLLSDTQYLNKVLNYYFFHETNKYNVLLSACIESVCNSCNKASYEKDSQRNDLKILTTIYKFSFENKKNLLKQYFDLFKELKVWTKNKSDAFLLLDLLQDEKDKYLYLINIWFSCALKGEHDFYLKICNKAHQSKIVDESIIRMEILLACNLTNNFVISEGKPTELSEESIKSYLSYTGDYSFVTKIISAIDSVIGKEDCSIYVTNFKLLLPYCKEEDKTKFELIHVLADKLVSFGEFSYADKLYRYMLSFGINLSLCYWGLLFCSNNSRNLEELSSIQNLFENELFQETLHLSKEEDPKIYKQCLDLYESHKNYKEKKATKRKEKNINIISTLAILLLLANSIAFMILDARNVSGTWWPYFLVAVISFGFMIAVIASRSGSDKRIAITSTIGLLIVATSLSVVGTIHIVKASNADDNYTELRKMMTTFNKNGNTYSIKNKIEQIPSTYRDVQKIKEEVDDLERIFNKYNSGRDEWGKVYNFDFDHSNWDCSYYLYNYSFRSLFINSVWDIQGTSQQLTYYSSSSGDWFSPSSALPNDMDSKKDYYFYTEYDYFNDNRAMVNQYMRFGYENKQNPNDKFLAYEIGDYRINSQGKRQIKVFCYSNNTEYKLVFNRNY